MCFEIGGAYSGRVPDCSVQWPGCSSRDRRIRPLGNRATQQITKRNVTSVASGASAESHGRRPGPPSARVPPMISPCPGKPAEASTRPSRSVSCEIPELQRRKLGTERQVESAYPCTVADAIRRLSRNAQSAANPPGGPSIGGCDPSCSRSRARGKSGFHPRAWRRSARRGAACSGPRVPWFRGSGRAGLGR